ncbi:MAG: GDP-L-fucose synthase [Gemmatimonadota bacterium]
MRPADRVYVAGHRGLVGSATVRRLEEEGFDRLLLRTRAELDLTDAAAVDRFFADEQPQYVFLAAAKVGGIVANDTYPADFIRDNLAIQLHVIDAAHRNGADKLLFLGSSCVYPKHAPQPMKEEHLLTGLLEPTNEAYAIAKIAGIKMCESYRRQYGSRFISVMPTNLYGPNDNFNLETSHVLPALIRRFHEARQAGAPAVTLWGTGTPRREFLHVDDLADACVHLMRTYDESELINVGWCRDIAIRELAEAVARVVGYEGELDWDVSRPDGTPRKLLDTSRLTALGWTPRIELEDGIRQTYAWYQSSLDRLARNGQPTTAAERAQA